MTMVRKMCRRELRRLRTFFWNDQDLMSLRKEASHMISFYPSRLLSLPRFFFLFPLLAVALRETYFNLDKNIIVLSLLPGIFRALGLHN